MTTALLEQKTRIERYLEEAPGQLSSFSFINIFTWQEFFQFELEMIDGNLCVFARHEAGTFLYLPPLGRNVSPGTIAKCFERMERVNRSKGVSRVENVHAHQLPLFPAEEFSYYNKGYEYCYYRKDIAALEGNAYKSKRSSYNQFVKNYAFKYLPYDDSMQAACGELYRSWAQSRRPAYAGNAVSLQMLKENAGVHQLVLRYYKELGLTGRVVTVDGREAPPAGREAPPAGSLSACGSKIRAYTFGYPLKRDIFCVLFEIADLSFNGLSVFVFREFCRDAAIAPYKFINVMDDFELENVSRTKKSFKPVALLPSYVVTRK